MSGATACGASSKAIQRAEDLEKQKMELYLRREVRALQRNYNTFQDGLGFVDRLKSLRCHHTMRVMKQMKEEKKQLLLLIHIDETKDSKLKRKRTEEIDKLMRIYSNQTVLVGNCSSALKEIGQHVNHIMSKFRKQQLEMQKLYGGSKTLEQVTSKIDNLENKLCVETTKYGQTVASSTKIRKSIHGCLAERSIFFKRMKKYKYSIQWVKGQMNGVVNQINQCFDKYDDAKRQESHWVHRDEVDCLMFLNDMKESGRFLKNDQYIHQFLAVKNRLRPSLEVEADRIRRRMQSAMVNTSELVPRYRKAFKLIADVSGTQDVDKTRQSYLDTDQNNFVLFGYIVEVADCCEALSQEVHELRQKIVSIQQFHADRRRACLKKLKEEKDKNHQATHEMHTWRRVLKEKLEDVTRIVNDFENIFKLAGADQEAVVSILGDSAGITPTNILSYLRILEHRILLLTRQKEMMIASSTARQREINETIAKMLKVKNNNVHYGGPIRPSLTVPAVLDTKSDDEENDKEFSKRRFTYGELKDLCREIVAKSVDFIRALTDRYSESNMDMDDDHFQSQVHPAVT